MSAIVCFTSFAIIVCIIARTENIRNKQQKHPRTRYNTNTKHPEKSYSTLYVHLNPSIQRN